MVGRAGKGFSSPSSMTSSWTGGAMAIGGSEERGTMMTRMDPV